MRFIESLGVKNGLCKLLSYHQARMDYTYEHFFNKPNPYLLEELIQTVPETGVHKFRLVYDEEIQEITSQEYVKKLVNTLKVVENDELNYAFKSENRKSLVDAYENRGNADDVLILRNGMITDSYYANLAFWDGSEWHTPKSPLLKGTRRQSLIDYGQLVENELGLEDLKNFEKVSLINAMIDLSELELNIDQIIL